MLEPADQQYVLLGYIAQAHGVDGSVLLIPEIYAPALFDDLDLVRVQNTRGDLVPARIESVRTQEKNNRLSFFVKFDHITDRTEAETLKSHRIYADRAKVGHLVDEASSGSLLSFEVKQDGEHVGRVHDLIDNPAHPILVVDTGDDSADLLIPFVEEYIESTDEEHAIVYCTNLDQLRSSE